MAIEIDLIIVFGKYCGMTDDEMATYREHALKQNIGIIKYNGLATTESEYVTDSSGFIDFRE